MVAGLGVTLMIIALAVGVIQGSAADTNAVGLLFAGGLVLFILGAGSWFAIVQPQKHFDDINQPAEADHHGHADDHALAAVSDEQHPETTGHSH
jgi:hypothetical protein